MACRSAKSNLNEWKKPEEASAGEEMYNRRKSMAKMCSNESKYQLWKLWRENEKESNREEANLNGWREKRSVQRRSLTCVTYSDCHLQALMPFQAEAVSWPGLYKCLKAEAEEKRSWYRENKWEEISVWEKRQPPAEREYVPAREISVAEEASNLRNEKIENTWRQPVIQREREK